MIDSGQGAGEKLFNVFPDNPGDPFADGAANLFDSLRIVAETGQSHAMAVQRYDVRGPTGKFVERYWQPLNSPVLNENGDLVFILNRVDRRDGKNPAQGAVAPLKGGRRGRADVAKHLSSFWAAHSALILRSAGRQRNVQQPLAGPRSQK